MNSIEPYKRIDTLDYLRGFALLGIILVNILPLLSVRVPAPHSTGAAYQIFLYLFVEGRFYTIFSFLFGVGFYLFISRAKTKGKNGLVLFLRRILALFIFGVIHFMFHPGEALTVYAICGLILLPFYKMKKEVNLVIGLLMLIAISYFSFKIFMTVPLMLIGIAAGQYRVFEGIARKTKEVVIFTAIMLLFSVFGLLYQYQHVPSAPFDLFGPGPVDVLNIQEMHPFLRIGIIIGPIVSALYVGILILLLRSECMRKLLSPLKYYGRMALTNYIAQTAFIYLAGNVFSLFNQITYIQSFFICVMILVIQLIFSRCWLHFFRFGPFELIWRSVTYLTVPPLKETKLF